MQEPKFLSGLVLMVDEGSPAMQLTAARLLAKLASDTATCKAICQVIHSPACLHLEESRPQTSARACSSLEWQGEVSQGMISTVEDCTCQIFQGVVHTRWVILGIVCTGPGRPCYCHDAQDDLECRRARCSCGLPHQAASTSDSPGAPDCAIVLPQAPASTGQRLATLQGNG